jgi:RHS repeat-associated protein
MNDRELSVRLPLTLLCCLLGLTISRAAAGGVEPVIPENLPDPSLKSRQAGLEFSTNPTTHEILRARVFEEPLVPIGGEPSAEENAALAAALRGYEQRSGPDDFASLTSFLDKHPQSPWRAALLTCLGLEYYNTAHYSLCLDAWEKAWAHAKDAKNAKGKAIADRAVGELAYMYARVGRMNELEALLKSVENRAFVGAATERITGAGEGLWHMQNKPEIAFKCGPYALQQILKSDQNLLTSSRTNALKEIRDFPSTQQGVSLAQVADLSKKVGLNFQMAFRGALKSEFRNPKSPIEFVVPSVVHWKVGHYAALVRQEGDRFLLEDPTFGNTVWATRQALEAESSGYFLIPPGALPGGWRSVAATEGASIWGKGFTSASDPDPHTPNDHKTPNDCESGSGAGMAVSSVHLMLVSLNIVDTPVGYSPPVGPSVQFTVRYNQREARQPANFAYANFGPKWTCDWISYLTDNPQNPSADAKLYARGGGTRTFTGFNAGTQTYAFEQYDQTQLIRTSTNSYELTQPDGSKLIFSQSDGSIGTSRKIFLTQIRDPFGNALTLTYDGGLRLVAITDAIGQVTTVTYLHDDFTSPDDGYYLISRVTDPFGRFATFEYDFGFSTTRLIKITDVIGLTSQFAYQDIPIGGGLTNRTDFIQALITPYGTNTFVATSGGTRSLETVYADGSRDRVEYTQSGIPAQPDPPSSVPAGMLVVNDTTQAARNTFYWSRTACASSYGDYTKAKIYHWLHKDTPTTGGIIESTKEALEGRVWYHYDQGFGAAFPGTSSRPTKIGRVLDDGQTQLYTYAYNGFGHLTNSIDPVGRTFSYLYASNGIDLLEVRQTRAGQNELLARMTYNAQHLPLTTVGADGQTNTFTYNARGQLLTETNPKGETTSYTYDTNGYVIAVDGPLPGTNDTVKATYDALGRVQTKTDESGYTLAFEHDAMDRLIKITHPDGSFSSFHYHRLDVTNVVDRAGRQTLLEFDNVRQMKKKTDPLGRVTLFDWCRCGSIKGLTDPMGRTTSWHTDVQGRVTAKQYADGSQVKYVYENTSSRVRHVIDEKGQISQFTYNLDDTLKSMTHLNSVISTPGVSYTYDPNYQRRVSMTDGTGTTLYSYNPIASIPALGANQLASVDGPLPNDTITYAYDELGRRISTAINDAASTMTYDAAGRVVTETNALGTFTYAYDGASDRLLTNVFPNGLRVERGYGGNLEDRELERITHKLGATPVSEFLYGRDHLAHRITTWSQQVGATPPSLHTFGYDAADQLLSATVTNSGSLINAFAYTYDLLGNRLAEQVGASHYTATYNALNQISTSTTPATSRTNEWDAKDRLVAVNAGNQRTEFKYDGMSRMVSIRQLTNSIETSFRRLVWCENAVCEERNAAGAVTKRFFEQGMKVESGPNAGSYFYTRDHLGSIRELTDGTGAIRARYAYDPYGRSTRLTGDMEADFGFTGMFWAAETGLALTRFRFYDAELGRWLSRDPLDNAEEREGPNLYAYVGANPVNMTDPLGLSRCCEQEALELKILNTRANRICKQAGEDFRKRCRAANNIQKCQEVWNEEQEKCQDAISVANEAWREYHECLQKPCRQRKYCPKPELPRPSPFPLEPDPDRRKRREENERNIRNHGL